MTLPEGVFIALGILAYVILWRYIFLQFFKLVKPSEDSQDSIHEPEPNLLDVLFVNCNESSVENHQESCQIVANILPKKQSIVLTFEPFFRVLKEFEHFDKFLDAYKSLKLCLRSGIGRCGKSALTEKDKSRIPKLPVMEVLDDDVKVRQRPGNRVFRDIDGAFGTLEVMECHAMLPDIKPNVQLGREEKDLNTIIRRLVAAQLMKSCEKKRGAISRAHSDTNNRVNWKRNKYSKQGVNYQAKEFHQTPRESICDSGNPESGPTFSVLSIKYDDVLGERINSDVTPKFVTENVAEGDLSRDFQDNDDSDDKGSIAIAEDDASIFSRDGYSVKKISEPENAESIEEPETHMIRTTAADTILEPNTMVGKFEDASTQTEHMYMIRAVRSCPGRRRRLQLLGTPRGMSKARSSGKATPMEISLSGFLHRKASDNLIYEMSKASRSPSYIPVPERFRWRYVTPTKVN